MAQIGSASTQEGRKTSRYEWEIIDWDELKYQLKKNEHLSTCLYFKNMIGSRKFCQRGSNFNKFFFIYLV